MAAYIRNTILVLLVALFAWLGAQCVFEENIFQLLPQTGEEAFRVTFENLKLKDKLFVQAVPAEGAETPNPYELAEALDLFMARVVEETQDRQDILYTLSDIDPMMLIDAVEWGTGTYAQVEGVSVAGKTGTAETGKPADDSWFVGFAPAEHPSVVVAIVLEQAVDSEYSDNAALKSQNVLQTALQKKGVL